jgi:outer membrane cobalamin receptor
MKQDQFRRWIGAAPAAILVLLGALPGVLHAGDAPDLTDLSLQELMSIDLVYGASKYEQKVTEAPSSVSIVTAADIKRYGWRTLSDILASIPGIFTTYDRDYSYSGVRGFKRPNDYNLRTLLLIDGHRANDNIYNSALIGTEELLYVDDIDRVEVIRGPSSSIYGAGAFFSVINILTRSGGALKGFEVAGASASYDTGVARISWGTKTAGGVETLVDGSGSWSGGQDLYFPEFNDPVANPLSANNGVAEGVDGDNSYRALVKTSVKGFTLEAAHSSRTKVLPAAPYQTLFNDPDNSTLDERTFLDLRYRADLTDTTNLLSRVYADRYYYHGHYDYPAPGGLYIEKAYGYTAGAEMQLTVRPSPNSTVIAGAEYRDHYRQDFYADDDSGPIFDEKRDSSDWALYAQGEFMPDPHLLLNLGVRHDQYDSFGGSTNPRLALIYTPVDKTTLKFLQGYSFRAPSMQELYYGTGANPALGPEKIRTYELVLEQYLGKGLRLSGTVFMNTIDDLISLDTTTTLFENAGVIDSRGSELTFDGKFRNGASIRLGYAIQDTRIRDNDEPLSNSPRHLAKFHLYFPFAGTKLSAGTEVLYTSGRLTLAGNDVGGYTVVNLTLLSQDVAPGLTLSLSAYNLLDKTYFDPGSAGNIQDTLQQNGRNYRLKFIWKF